jgi:hypothetical protein
MEALCSSETSVATQRITRRHIPENDTLQSKTFLSFYFLKILYLKENKGAQQQMCRNLQRRATSTVLR